MIDPQTLMTWLLLATGFTGGLTLVFLARRVKRWLFKPVEVWVRYSPKGGCTEAVVGELNQARREILVQAYSFTSRPIAQALVDAKARGVHVDILLDRSNEAETHTELGELLGQGIKPLIDAEHAIAHNKVMIIDGHTIVTGSFNFTNQAEHENAENLLVIKHHRDLARAYRENFLNHKSHCQPATKPNAAGHGDHQRRAA
jgi:phosphatidylserine/phosphatidylglycerophosphate/cardiolipin synthase-like enzyme